MKRFTATMMMEMCMWTCRMCTVCAASFSELSSIKGTKHCAA